MIRRLTRYSLRGGQHLFDFKIVSVIGAAIAIASSLVAHADTAATYVGAGACRNCHGETAQFTGGIHPKTEIACDQCHSARHNDIVKGYAKSAHASALIDVEESPSKLKAKFAAGSPVKKEQIAYALGVGTVKQAYLDSKLMLIPGYWSAVDNKWVVTPSASVPKKPAVAKGVNKSGKAAAPAASAKPVLLDASKKCVGCHTTGYNPSTKVWDFAGVSCESCHGAGSNHVRAGEKTQITNPTVLSKERQAMICGQCHSKGTDISKTYAFPINFKPGDDLGKFFIDAKPKTAGFNQQYSELVTSKHYTAGVICTSCHNPHGPVTGTTRQLIKPVIDLCTGCHKEQQLAKHAPGSPAGTTCATCHMPEGVHTFN